MAGANNGPTRNRGTTFVDGTHKKTYGTHSLTDFSRLGRGKWGIFLAFLALRGGGGVKSRPLGRNSRGGKKIRGEKGGGKLFRDTKSLLFDVGAEGETLFRSTLSLLEVPYKSWRKRRQRCEIFRGGYDRNVGQTQRQTQNYYHVCAAALFPRSKRKIK